MKRKSKDEIIAEYISGDYTFRELGTKYDITYRTIGDWVLQYQGRKIFLFRIGVSSKANVCLVKDFAVSTLFSHVVQDVPQDILNSWY